MPSWKINFSSRTHVLIGTWLGTLFDGMDASIFALTLHPSLTELLRSTSDSEIGHFGSIILAMFMFGWALGAIIFGILADYIGRAKTLIITVLMYAICTALCASSHSWQELAFYRVLVGCGIGGEISLGGVILAETWSGKSRLHATGILQTAFSFGCILLATVNLAIGSYGWRWLYIVGVVPALLAVYFRLKLKEPENAKAIREYRNSLRAKPKSALSAHEAQLLAFTLPQLFRKENRWKVLTVVLLASSVMTGNYAVLAWIPAWINQLTGTLAVQERSITDIALNSGSIIGAATAGFFILGIGRAKSFRLAYTLALIGCLSLFLTVKTYSLVIPTCAFFIGFFAIAPYSYLFIYVPELFDTRLRATAFAFSIQTGRIFAGMAALLGGQLISFFSGSYALAAACVSSFYMFGIVASFFMPNSSGNVSSEETTAS